MIKNKVDIDYLVQVVFDDTKKYLDGNQIVYNKEGNFFYVLHQSWSGDVTDEKGIEKIRLAAAKGLQKNEKALELYWNHLPYDPSFQSIDDILEINHFRAINSNELYMPLEKLIEISNKAKIKNIELQKKIAFWKKIAADSTQLQKYKDAYKIKNTNDTLYVVFKSVGLVK